MTPDRLLMQAMLGRTESALAELCEVQRLVAAPDHGVITSTLGWQPW